VIVNDLESGAQGTGAVALLVRQGTVAHFQNLTWSHQRLSSPPQGCWPKGADDFQDWLIREA
jgi:hypothetical protein